MRLPVLRGLIRRRLLVNFRVDPDAIQKLLPAPFRPKLHEGYAVAGICLIRLEDVRPARLPARLGISSENAAHRVAVEWSDDNGDHEAVFIPRRDTGSVVNALGGGRLFPGEHHRAAFAVVDDGDRIDLRMASHDGAVAVRLRGRGSDVLPAGSCFGSLEAASRFFEGGSLGYSVTSDGRRLDGLRLRTHEWRIQPLAVEDVHSSFFMDDSTFAPGTAEFDHALIMRDVPHEWRKSEDLYVAR